MPRSEDSIKVAVRVRPFNAKEKVTGKASPIVSVDDKMVQIKTPVANARSHKAFYNFTYDYSLWSFDPKDPEYADQARTHELIGRPVVKSAVQGFNTCVLAYGQTGTGKTHTMMGSGMSGGNDTGLIPRICKDLFAEIGDDSKVTVSYYEIYNESVYDLLLATTAKDPKGKFVRHALKVREHKVLGPYVDGLTQLAVNSFDIIAEVLDKGGHNRHVAETKMNAASSRSHAVLMLNVEMHCSNGGRPTLSSKIALVDLAGSERQTDTGAQGKRLGEGSAINQSLTALGNVIFKLSKSSKTGKKTHIPYRDSTLTWVLKEFLGGNARTTMIANIGPHEKHFENTLSTLQYVDHAKHIENRASVNEDENEKIVRELKEHVAELEAELALAREDQGRLSPAMSEETQRQLEVTHEIIEAFGSDWEEQIQQTAEHVKEMNEWKAVTQHNVAKSRWRFAQKFTSLEARSAKQYESLQAKIKVQADAADDENFGHLEQIVQLEEQLAMERQKNEVLLEKLHLMEKEAQLKSGLTADADISDRFELELTTTKGTVSRLHELAVYFQRQFDQKEETDGTDAITEVDKGYISKLQALEAGMSRFLALLEGPEMTSLGEMESANYLRKLPAAKVVTEEVRLRHISFAESDEKATWTYLKTHDQKDKQPSWVKAKFVSKRLISEA